MTSEQWIMFLEIWNSIEEGFRWCQSCGKQFYGPPKPLYFDHLLEKSKYPELTLVKENIFLVCGLCHDRKNKGNPTKKHQEAIDKAIKTFLSDSSKNCS